MKPELYSNRNPFVIYSISGTRHCFLRWRAELCGTRMCLKRTQMRRKICVEKAKKDNGKNVQEKLEKENESSPIDRSFRGRVYTINLQRVFCVF